METAAANHRAALVAAQQSCSWFAPTWSACGTPDRARSVERQVGVERRASSWSSIGTMRAFTTGAPKSNGISARTSPR